jgi:hypothetical protein
MIYKKLLLVYAILAMTGCASITQDVTHPMKVETMTSDNHMITGAECKLTNDRESVTMKSGNTVKVRRSGEDLQIACKHPTNPAAIAKARAISRANAGMFGNILIGGGVGAIIDHNKGTAYTYPTWVQLVFGKDLVFDRKLQKKKDQPTPATNLAVTPAVVVKSEVKQEEVAESVVEQAKIYEDEKTAAAEND